MEMSKGQVKPGVAWLLTALLTLALAACGGQRMSHHSVASTSKRSSGTQTSYVGGFPHLPGPRLSLALTRRLLDYPKIERSILRERGLIFAYYYGQPASATDSRAVEASVQSYYAIAARGDGHLACSRLLPSVAKALPAEYGRHGPAYLHGTTTCTAVLSRMFARSHARLSARPKVRGVLANSNDAYAFVESSKMPVSVMEVKRVEGRWLMATALAAPALLNGRASIAAARR
jgi:hypothetical protein